MLVIPNRNQRRVPSWLVLLFLFLLSIQSNENRGFKSSRSHMCKIFTIFGVPLYILSMVYILSQDSIQINHKSSIFCMRIVRRNDTQSLHTHKQDIFVRFFGIETIFSTLQTILCGIEQRPRRKKNASSGFIFRPPKILASKKYVWDKQKPTHSTS